MGADPPTFGATIDETVKEASEVIERNARIQMRPLIEDLLDVSRIASGKMRLDMQPMRPNGGHVSAALDTVAPDGPGRRG